MKHLILISLLFSVNLAFAQFAVIKGENDVNVRTEANPESEIITTLEKGTIVYAFGFSTSEGYYPIEVEKDGKKINGYIKANQFSHLVSAFENDGWYFKPKLTKDGKSIRISHNSASVTITKKPFIETENEIKYSDKYRFVEKINRKEFYGTDGTIPKFQYEKIEIEYLGEEEVKTIEVPKSTYDNLYQPNLKKTDISYDKINDTIYLEAMNSDGAGGHAVLWIFKNGVFERQMVVTSF